VARPPPFGQEGGRSTSIWLEWGWATPFIYLFILNYGILKISTYIRGNFGIFVQKNECVVHMSYFSVKEYGNH